MTIKCEVKLTTPEGTPLMALNLWWGRNKNSKIDQLHAFQSCALYQAVKIADLSGEKLSFFTQITTENSFLFIYHHSFWNDISFFWLAIHVYIRARRHIYTYISNNHFQGISFTWSLLADETRLSVSSDLKNIVILIVISWSKNVVILISGDLWNIMILKFYSLWNVMAMKSFGSRSFVAYIILWS